MLSRLNVIGSYSRVSKLLPIKRYRSNFTVANADLPKIEKDKDANGGARVEGVEDEDLDLKQDRCMFTKDAKIETVDINGQKIEPININPWYEEEEFDEAVKAGKEQTVDAPVNPAMPTDQLSETK